MDKISDISGIYLNSNIQIYFKFDLSAPGFSKVRIFIIDGFVKSSLFCY